MNIYYISDLHLDYIADRLGKNADKLGRRIARGLARSVPDKDNVLLIAGDVSDGIDSAAGFYAGLREYWRGVVISILGNHEYWDFKVDDASGAVDLAAEFYSDIMSWRGRKGTGALLRNSLCAVTDGNGCAMFSEDKVLSMPRPELIDLRDKSRCLILGGTGFSGMNFRLNAGGGAYNNAVRTIGEDMALSSRFEKLHDHLRDNLGDRRVVILTHNPKGDWSPGAHNPGWIYVSGHTHENGWVISDDIMALFDNQIYGMLESGDDLRTCIRLRRFLI